MGVVKGDQVDSQDLLVSIEEATSASVMASVMDDSEIASKA